MKKKSFSVEYIKSLGKEKNDVNLKLLLEIYHNEEISVKIKREVVSSIGRQSNKDLVYEFIQKEAFCKNVIMEFVYQMFRTCLYNCKTDMRFENLRVKIMKTYDNEVINKMNDFYFHKGEKRIKGKRIEKPTILLGDTEKTLLKLDDNSIQLMFTSPPYYNAREYSDYHSYKDYLKKMKTIFSACNRVLEEGRFFIVNVSPVITKRPGREFESIRYPIHYDFHEILEESGFYFIDEIIWIKPEPSVCNRVGGYEQSRTPLGYKPNCITESIMVYRKKCNFLLDKNINDYHYSNFDKHENEKIDKSNCWEIAPKSDANHPAVFPEELCRRILKYYSFENDVVLDPFAGSGTFGRVAIEMGRIPIMCEINKKYANVIKQRNLFEYEIQ